MSDEKKYHEYDGIIEHDNPLPTWWLWTFLLTIIFAFMYFIHYSLGTPGLSLHDELKTAMDELEKQKAIHVVAAPMETEDSLKEIFEKPDVIALGAAQFTAKCAACHGADLQGLIGPDLTDAYWIHGKGHRLDILKVVREGVPDKGMPPWGPVMKRDEIYAVASFIISKKGSHPAGSKGPQGDISEDYK
jgi:cytochrome c oxidase cbb3-type subunit 3